MIWELRRPGNCKALLIDSIERIVNPQRLPPPIVMRTRVGSPFSDVHGQQFESIGRHFRVKLIEDAGLSVASRVLDLGSGCGRLAIPLTGVIGSSGSYFGLEAVQSMVRWCQRHITPRFPHFRFVHADVRNRFYNPRGKENPESYRFPFDEHQFDLIIAASVFTHLQPGATQNYISQCSRVLQPGGRLFATFFVLENGDCSADGELQFRHGVSDIASTTNPTSPEAAIAYRIRWLMEVFRESHLELLLPIRWGNWTGKNHEYSWQDVLICEKRR